MSYGNDQNPYAPPSDLGDLPPPFGYGDDEEIHILAERGDRFLARLLDVLLSIACVIPWMMFALSMGWLSFGDPEGNDLMALILAPATIPLAIYQWVLVSKTGQTLGKKWLRIRVVKLDGSPVGFVHGVLLREWIAPAISVVPCVGPLIDFIGYLMIFGEMRRCLHDIIAGTMVVKTLS